VKSPLRIGVLLSGKGRGSNLQALLDACRAGRIPGQIALVVSTTPGAPALERAAAAGVPHCVISAAEYPDPGALDAALGDAFAANGAGLICLAGYMRLLSAGFLARFPVMNVHPSLLPAFGGKGYYGRRVHQAVLDYGARLTGVTVHFVDEEYDHGPIILQQAVSVLDDDTPESLAARVLAEEHHAYPEAVRLFAEGRLEIHCRRVRILPEPR
jgi:phosphoribosylglycinamide formyltransferase 1